MQILASILGCLDDPNHVAAAASTCKRLRELSKSAPLHLRIAPCRFMREDADGVETLRQDHLRAFLTALCAQFKGDHLSPAQRFTVEGCCSGRIARTHAQSKHASDVQPAVEPHVQGTDPHGMPIDAGVSELSLRKLPIELEDLEQVKAGLPQLKILHLSEAQKLPPNAVSILLAPHARGGVLHSALLGCRHSPDCFHLCFSRLGRANFLGRGATRVQYTASNGIALLCTPWQPACANHAALPSR